MRDNTEVWRFCLLGDGGPKSRTKYGCPSAHHKIMWANGGTVPIIPSLATRWSDGWASRACDFTIGQDPSTCTEYGIDWAP